MRRMGFEGWPPEAVAWFEGLEQDNSKAYFQRTRDVYEASVKAPLLALLAELADEFGEGRMFRPYRDVRFTADKSPYKTQASALLAQRDRSASYYVELSMDGLLAASGYYHMARDQLERYRRAVDDPETGEPLAKLVEDLRAAGYQVHGEELKTAPRGFSRDHPRIELLRRKGIALMADVPPGPDVYTRAALDHVRETWRAAAPLNAWLVEHVGPSEEPPGR
jgi:uncharacterized protein (TIGR02453 family)